MAWHSDPYISGQVTATVLNWQETEEGKDILVGGGSEDKASACNAEDPGLILRLGRSPGEGNSDPLQYSCLENPMGRGAWRATVHGVAG